MQLCKLNIVYANEFENRIYWHRISNPCGLINYNLSKQHFPVSFYYFKNLNEKLSTHAGLKVYIVNFLLAIINVGLK